MSQNADLYVNLQPKCDGSDTCLLLISESFGYLILNVEILEEVTLEYILNVSNIKYGGCVLFLDVPDYDGVDVVVYIERMHQPSSVN